MLLLTRKFPADERLRYPFPLFLNPTTSGLVRLSAPKRGSGTKLRATIIDSVTDNKHYFYR